MDYTKEFFTLAIISRSDHGYLIDHEAAINRDVQPLNYEFKAGLFDLWRPYIETASLSPKRKRKRTTLLNEQQIKADEEHSKIKDVLSASTSYIVRIGRELGYFKDEVKNNCHGVLRERAQTFPVTKEVVEHVSESPSMVQLQDGWYIIPPRAAYLISDVTSLQPLIDYTKLKGLFDVIVLDPPWYNKSAKRSGRYSFLSLWQIKNLPIPKFLNSQGLVVVWVTNKPKYIDFTKRELFDHWGIEYLAEWHWVKVTKTGQLVVDLDSKHKRPYETLILGRLSKPVVQDSPLQNNTEICTSQQSATSENQCTNAQYQKPIPEHVVICSVPCQIHSRKPPLKDILLDYMHPDVRCLEMFARNLTAGWTSWGNEVLKFQSTDYFDNINVSSKNS